MLQRGIFWQILVAERTCKVNTMGENSSFNITCYVKTVPVYDFTLVWVVLHLSEQTNDVLFIESF